MTEVFQSTAHAGPLVDLEHVETLVDGLDQPEGVASGPDGSLYAGDEAGQVYCVSLTGAEST